MSLKIKICGMRDSENIREVAKLEPDMMGFIFYGFSPRFTGDSLDPEVLREFPLHIKKVGVFVNQDLSEIRKIIEKYSLDMIQLHGEESTGVCRELTLSGTKVIKAFRINAGSDFKKCREYSRFSEYYLFDTASGGYGGSGTRFDWKLLNSYKQEHPFFLSGGIGENDSCDILEIRNNAFRGVDLNSRFEVKPALKNTEALKKFIAQIR